MAIQKINDALPTGDSPRKINEKINENFSNPDHAASRLVGTGVGQVPLSEDVVHAFFDSTSPLRVATSEIPNEAMTVPDEIDFSRVRRGAYYIGSTVKDKRMSVPEGYGETQAMLFYATPGVNENSTLQLSYKFNTQTELNIRAIHNGSVRSWAKVYTDVNTKKDNNTNLLLESGDSIPSDSAASKLVGTTAGRVPLIGDNFYEYLRLSNTLPTQDLDEDLNNLKGKAGRLNINIGVSLANKPNADSYSFEEKTFGYGGVTWAYGARQPNKIWIRNWAQLANNGNYNNWGYIYTSSNTKLDTNGAIAPSSPTIDLYSDRIETNSDGARMNPEFVRNGVGDYTIKNTTGLRDEGWYIKIPNDMNGNPKVAVAIDTDKDGNLNIKTYKRTFSLETFTFGPDLSEPLDIPEGRWIDLRFNDLPEEELEEPVMDEEIDPEATEEEPTEEPEVVEEEEEPTVEDEDVPVEEEPKD